MPRQLNPAWQRKNVSSDHLAKVGARFLSDGPQAGQSAEGCQVISFLLVGSAQEWIVSDLCGVLTQRGRRSHWQNLATSHPQSEDDGVGAALNAAQAAGSSFCLLATTSAATLRRHRFNHLILLVPASLDGVMTAYRRVKGMAGEDTPEIGVVIVGPRDQHAAWRYFRKLAVGTLRYLDVPLLNLGFLPQEVTPENGPPDHHRQNFLARISERLLSSGFHSPYSPATDTGQAE